jgi:hypothetical protein
MTFPIERSHKREHIPTKKTTELITLVARYAHVNWMDRRVESRCWYGHTEAAPAAVNFLVAAKIMKEDDRSHFKYS